MTVPVFITLIVGILAIFSALIGFGFKIGIESQKSKHLAKSVAELEEAVRRVHLRIDRLTTPDTDERKQG